MKTADYGFSGEPWQQVGWRWPEEPVQRFAKCVPITWKPGLTIADIGCGNGLLVDWIRSNYESTNINGYVGYDADDDFIQQFKTRHPSVTAKLGSVDQDFDVAFSFGVAADLGLIRNYQWTHASKHAALGKLISSVLPHCRTYTLDFWDEREFKVPGVVAWNMDELVNRYGKNIERVIKPVVGQDFALVLHGNK